MSSKGNTGGPRGHNLKFTLDILELMKKSLSGFNGTFSRNLVGTIAFLIFLRGLLNKTLGNPDMKQLLLYKVVINLYTF